MALYTIYTAPRLDSAERSVLEWTRGGESDPVFTTTDIEEAKHFLQHLAPEFVGILEETIDGEPEIIAFL